MNLTAEFIDELRTTARAYDNATDATTRAILGDRLDKMASQLSNAQIDSVCKILKN